MARPTQRGFRFLVEGSWFGGSIRGAGTSGGVIPVVVALRCSFCSLSFLVRLCFAAYSEGIAAGGKYILEDESRSVGGEKD